MDNWFQLVSIPLNRVMFVIKDGWFIPSNKGLNPLESGHVCNEIVKLIKKVKFDCLNPLESGHVCNFIQGVKMARSRYVSIPLNRVMFVIIYKVVYNNIFFLLVSIPLNRVMFVIRPENKQELINLGRLNPLESGHVCNRKR